MVLATKICKITINQIEYNAEIEWRIGRSSVTGHVNWIGAPEVAAIAWPPAFQQMTANEVIRLARWIRHEEERSHALLIDQEIEREKIEQFEDKSYEDELRYPRR